MSARQLIVIGASAGGLDALRTLVAALPADFPAPICVVVHTSPQSPGVLPAILARSGPLPAAAPQDLERLRPGRIYVAPPDHHLVIEPGRLRIAKGPRENRFRPAIDPLFRSAAQVYGPLAIGVVLTGDLDDGSAGLWAIKRLGGTAIVQDPTEALFPSMPRSALAQVDVDHCARIAEIGPLLTRLVAAPPADTAEVDVPEHIKIEVDIAKGRNPVDAGLEQIATPSPYACPECHGVLLKIDGGGQIRYRCHTGHAYSAESLVAEIEQAIDDALSNAIRALEEGGLLFQKIAEQIAGQAASQRGGHAATDTATDAATDDGRAAGRHAAMAARATAARAQSEAVRQLMLARSTKAAAVNSGS